MSASESCSTSSESCSRTNDSTHSSEDELVNETHFVPYQDEPLASSSDEECDQFNEDSESDLDGLTPSILEARFEQQIKISKWCSCGNCCTDRLVGALEYRCCREIGEALGKLTFDGSIERISCTTLHEDFQALINEAVLTQVGPLLKDRRGRSYHRRSAVPLKEYLRAVGYRWIARWLFGYMGPENTRPLSACIYTAIREKYNTGHGNSTGYVDGKERD